MFLFRLIFLPFTLLGSLLGLVGISTRIFLFPLKFFARNTMLCLLLIGAFILYQALKSNPNVINEMKPLPQDKQAKALPKGALPLIDQPTKFEDGNSRFATDVYKTMTDEERENYSRVYYAVMSGVEDGKPWTWSYYNINGVITPTQTFRNNSGEICRKFTETLKVHKVQQTLSGTACDNGGGSWCKLKVNATPSCGLGGGGGGFFNSLGSAFKGLF